MPSSIRASSTLTPGCSWSGTFEDDPTGDKGDGDGIIGPSLALLVVFCKCAASGFPRFSDGLLNELGVRPPDDTRWRFGREMGPLMVLAPSPNPTRLALPSSLILPTLDVPSSMVSSLILLSASKASLPLAQVVRPPTLPVALALPTVLRSRWLCAVSKYPEVNACAAGSAEPGGAWLPLAARAVATRSNPARREMRSARSASRVFVELIEVDDDRCAW